MNRRVAILGLGWLGEPLAMDLHQKGYAISGSTTSLSKLETLSRHPYYVGRMLVTPDGIVGDWEALMQGVDVLTINFPPKRGADMEQQYLAQIQQIIRHTPSDVSVIFISSTSVYENTNTHVKEAHACRPTKAAGKALLKAEEALKSHFSERLTVLRLAGLIGPSRHPGTFLSGKTGLRHPHAPVNLIHQQDAIGLISAIITQQAFGCTLNGCADEHPTRQQFYTQAAEALGEAVPTFKDDEAPSHKIVDNEKAKALLNYAYQYADPSDLWGGAQHPPKVSIVGAGPGKVAWLTLEAFDRIQQADLVLHDHFVSEDIMNINPRAERLYVGRQCGESSSQEQRQTHINELMVKHSRQGKKVVRLKSGDPYIYGRAAEEVRYLMRTHTPFEVIPGISASLAAASVYHLPLTERNHSKSLLICTAHTADYSQAQWQSMAQMLKAGNTLALYMGLNKLHEIIPQLITCSGNPDLPISAVSNVSRSHQKILTSTLGKIEEDLRHQPLERPVVFLLGVTPIQ